MKFDTIFRIVFDGAIKAYQEGKDPSVVMRNYVLRIEGEADNQLKFRQVQFFERTDGPLAVLAFAYSSEPSQLVGAGLARVRSNHRLLVMRSQRLSDLGTGRHIYTRDYVEGTPLHGHKPVPRFDLGDLSLVDPEITAFLEQAEAELATC